LYPLFNRQPMKPITQHTTDVIKLIQFTDESSCNQSLVTNKATYYT